MKENSIENIQNKKYFKNIDEAIKVYKEFRKFKNDGFIESIDPDFFFNLTDMFLSDYKKLQEEFKQVDHECERLEEKEVRLIKENEQLRTELNSLKENKLELANNKQWISPYYVAQNYIPKQKVKAIIDRIDYDIKKTKEIISKNTDIHASYRKNDYQIVRLRAMNTKSLDIKKRLQELLDSEG